MHLFNGPLRVEAIISIDGVDYRIDLRRNMVARVVLLARMTARTLQANKEQSSLEGEADVLAGHCEHAVVN